MCEFLLSRPSISREKKVHKKKKYFVTIDDDGNPLRAARLPVVTEKKKKQNRGNTLQRCSVKSRADNDDNVVKKQRAEQISIFYHDAHSLVALMTQHGRVCRRKSKVRPVL